MESKDVQGISQFTTDVLVAFLIIECYIRWRSLLIAWWVVLCLINHRKLVVGIQTSRHAFRFPRGSSYLYVGDEVSRNIQCIKDDGKPPRIFLAGHDESDVHQCTCYVTVMCCLRFFFQRQKENTIQTLRLSECMVMVGDGLNMSEWFMSKYPF